MATTTTQEGVRVSGTLRSNGVIDIGEHCTHCGCDVSWGTGKYVNRVPSDADSGDGKHVLMGYICADCLAVECDLCGDAVLDDWRSDYPQCQGVPVCDECANKRGWDNPHNMPEEG